MGLSLVEIRVLNGSLVLGKQSAGSKRVFFLLDLELVRYLFYTVYFILVPCNRIGCSTSVVRDIIYTYMVYMHEFEDIRVYPRAHTG